MSRAGDGREGDSPSTGASPRFRPPRAFARPFNLRLRRKSRQVSREGGESSEASTARVSAPDRSQGRASPGGCSAAVEQGAEWFGLRCQPRRNVRRAERASEEHSESEVSKRQLRPSCRNCLGAVLEAAESLRADVARRRLCERLDCPVDEPAADAPVVRIGGCNLRRALASFSAGGWRKPGDESSYSQEVS